MGPQIDYIYVAVVCYHGFQMHPQAILRLDHRLAIKAKNLEGEHHFQNNFGLRAWPVYDGPNI